MVYDPLEVGVAPAIFPYIFIPPLIVEPLLLEATGHYKVESGSGLYSILTSTRYAGADCRSLALCAKNFVLGCESI